MTTKIQLRESAQSIADFTGYQLILLFRNKAGILSSITLPALKTGATNFTGLKTIVKAMHFSARL